MKLPLTLPLDNYPPRTITLTENPQGWLYPRVLQVELLHEGEVQAIADWLTALAAQAPGVAS